MSRAVWLALGAVVALALPAGIFYLRQEDRAPVAATYYGDTAARGLPNRSLVASEDRESVAFSNTYDDLYQWDINSPPRLVHDSTADDYPIAFDIVFYADNDLYVVGRPDLWRLDLSTGESQKLIDRTSPIEILSVHTRTTNGDLIFAPFSSLVRWSVSKPTELQPVLSKATIVPDSIVANDNYYVTRRAPIFSVSGEPPTRITAWSTKQPDATEPALTLTLDVRAYDIAIDPDRNRVYAVTDDTLNIWDLDTDTTRVIPNPNAGGTVHILPDGTVATSSELIEANGRLQDPNAIISTTRFFDPDSLDEISHIDGLFIRSIAQLSDNRVALSVRLDNPSDMRDDDAGRLGVEIWDLTELVHG